MQPSRSQDARKIDEIEHILLELTIKNVRQLARGAAPISPALHAGRLRWFRHDPPPPVVFWDVRQIWRHGGGQCGDFAAAVAAEYTFLLHRPARPRVYRVRDGLLHVVVEDLESGRWLDPSVTGGMRPHYE